MSDFIFRYTALDKSGQVDRLADLHDLGEVQAVNEDDIRAAIEELNRSTETISKQTETLRQQQDALARLVKKRDEAEHQRRDLEEERLNKTKHALKKLVFEVTQNPSVIVRCEVFLRIRSRSMERRRVSSIVLRIWSRLLRTHVPM
jgi:septal ring factor EnvC (AmiA/AmiB activator)